MACAKLSVFKWWGGPNIYLRNLTILIQLLLSLHHDRQYATIGSLKQCGGVFLRPWHLVFNKEAGLKGLLEPDSQLKSGFCAVISCFIAA